MTNEEMLAQAKSTGTLCSVCGKLSKELLAKVEKYAKSATTKDPKIACVCP